MGTVIPLAREKRVQFRLVKTKADYCADVFRKWCDREEAVAHGATRSRGTRWLDASEVCRKLQNANIADSCILDFLLAHTALIPPELTDKAIFFHGKCRHSGGICVRYLFCDNGDWKWSYWQGDGDGTNLPAPRNKEAVAAPARTAASKEVSQHREASLFGSFMKSRHPP